MSISLAELGEAELLRRLAHFAPPGQLSDDTAALPPDQRPLLVNTDVLVENIHFSDATTSAGDVGWRAVAANLSDLAASGAVGIDGITVALVAPGTTPWNWVEGVYEGIGEALQRFGGVLLGGDCSGGEQRLLSITALGRLGPLRLHRNGARPNDMLVTSGPHGLSRLGLALLQNDQRLNGVALKQQLRDAAIQAHQRPMPRLDAFQRLLESRPEGLPWRAGGTDSSDGLMAALQGLCTSSRCGANLDRCALPVAQHWPSGDLWTRWCLAGGEDFELVISLPSSWAERWLQCMPEGRCIGTITEEPGMIRWSDNGEPVDAEGFSHYSQI